MKNTFSTSTIVAQNISGYACKVAYLFHKQALEQGIDLSQSKAMRLAWAIAYSHYGIEKFDRHTVNGGRKIEGYIETFDLDNLQGKMYNVYGSSVKVDYIKTCAL